MKAGRILTGNPMTKTQQPADAVTEPKAEEGKPFLSHLEDLRLMLIRSAAALLAGMRGRAAVW